MVLHAAPCSPALGPARRHLHLFEEISDRHTVSIITLARPGDREQFEREHAGRYERAMFVSRRPRLMELLVGLWYVITLRCAFRRLYQRPLRAAIDAMLATSNFDVLYFSTVLLGYYRMPPSIRTIGDAHNVEHEVLARAASVARNDVQRYYFALQARLTERDEVWLARSFSEVWATSARDAERFAEVRGDRCVSLVPNGIRVSIGDTPAPVRRDRAPVLLFVGLMSYFPNSDAAAYFLDEILPLALERMPWLRVQIVGADPPRPLKARGGGAVEIVGRVPSVEPYYRGATVFVVPLRCGGGTRVKVLEAMAHGVPVVSTTLGCEGLSVRDGESVLLADTPAAFADAVARVCNDPALARRLVGGGSQLVRSAYDWRQIGESVHGILAQPAHA